MLTQLALFDTQNTQKAADELASSPDVCAVLRRMSARIKKDTQELRALVRTLGSDPDDVPVKAVKQSRGAQTALSEQARTVLTACHVTPATITLPAGELERGVYEQVKKVLEGIGGKWNTQQGCFTYQRDPTAQLEATLAAGKMSSTKKATQAFYTPADLVTRALSYAPPLAGLRVLEPSAGEGAFADVLRAAGALVQCAEFDPDSARVLREKGYQVREGDFLSWKPEPLYDLVVMNPPFARGQDIRHVEHALRFLRPGGQLLAIISPGFTFASTVAAKRFRAQVEAQNGLMEHIESGAFKHSGTSVSTVLIRLTNNPQPTTP